MDKKRVISNIGNALSQALMAGGQALTGEPIYSTFTANQIRGREAEIENNYRQMQMQRMQQEMDARQKFQEWLMSKGMGTGFGGGMSNGMGITGMSFDPITGESKINIGQTPEAKKAEEAQARTSKAAQEEESKAASGKALLDEIKSAWLETKPPKSGLLAMQPFYGAEQRMGAPLQITANQRKDYKYVRFIKSLRSRLAKGTIGTDVGNLSEYEQKVVSAGVPGLTDTYETGVDILDGLNKVIDRMKEARIKGYKNLDEMNKKEGMVLTNDKAREYLGKAGGDKEKARKMALSDGWYF